MSREDLGLTTEQLERLSELAEPRWAYEKRIRTYTGAMSDELKYVSNVIELKPDKKYLLVFKGDGINREMLDGVWRGLAVMGIECISLALEEHMELTVIEVPDSEVAK